MAIYRQWLPKMSLATRHGWLCVSPMRNGERILCNSDKSEMLNERSRRTEGEKGYLAPAAALNRFGRKQILISLASVGIREHYIRRAGVGPP